MDNTDLGSFWVLGSWISDMCNSTIHLVYNYTSECLYKLISHVGKM